MHCSSGDTMLKPQSCESAILSRDVSVPYLFNGSLSDNSHCVKFAHRIASFLVPVFHVFSGVTEKQVDWIDARWIITTMQYPLLFGNWSKMNFPRAAMRFIISNLAVSVFIKTSAPEPTAFGLPDLAPETNYPRSLLVAVSRAILTTVSRPRNIYRAAMLTGKCYSGFSQRVNLRDRFRLWSGSSAASSALGPFIFYHQCV